ncbi:MAG: hypothetical protein WBX25_16930 [Rhodomicrobium sp.]
MTVPKPKVAIVAGHFPPSNLAGVHRARLLCQHLHEFGWHPVVVTTHWRHYEEALDWDLASLVDGSLEVIYTGAAPTRPVRAVGDIGLRAMPWHLAALQKLRKAGRLDFLLITIPSYYSALLGELLYRRSPLPFGIDYIDPWVNSWPATEIKYSKAWASLKAAKFLEPRAVKNASLITGVADGYFEGVLQRNPHLHDNCVTASMPYGSSSWDFDAPAVLAKEPSQFDASDGRLHIVYAGALLPKAFGILERFLEGLLIFRRDNESLADRVRVHFIGTGKSPNDEAGHNVQPIAERIGIASLVTEHPHRMAYLEVLAHLNRSYGVLIIGSTEPHYTPSKVFQAVQSKRPVLAILHEGSTAVEVLRRSGAGMAITLTEQALPSPQCIAEAFKEFLNLPYNPGTVSWEAFEAYSARESARKMALAMNEATALFQRRCLSGKLLNSPAKAA